MGLRMWSDPEKQDKRKQDAAKAADPTVAARSAIRRRQNVRPPRSPRSSAARPPPRFQRSDTLRDSRRTAGRAGVPPVSTLLESVDRQAARSPLPPIPFNSIASDHESRNSRELQEIFEQERALRMDIDALRSRAADLTRDAALLSQNRHWETAVGYVDTRAAFPAPSERHPAAPAFAQDHVPFSRSPEPISDSEPLSSAEERNARHSTLPTPLSDFDFDRFMEPDADPREFLRRRNIRTDSERLSRPLDHTERGVSPVNGLGDRDRSPVIDGWEVMRSTIAPDATLPSAESSFASAAASNSFTSDPSTRSTRLTEPDTAPPQANNLGLHTASSEEDSCDEVGRSDSEQDDYDLSEDIIMAITATVAKEMYLVENSTSRGKERIALLSREMNLQDWRHKLDDETDVVEIGLRIINDTLNDALSDGDRHDIHRTDATSSIVTRGLRLQVSSLFSRLIDVMHGRSRHMDDHARAYRRQMHAVFQHMTLDARETGLLWPVPERAPRVPRFHRRVGLLTRSETETSNLISNFNLNTQPPGFPVLYRALQHVMHSNLRTLIKNWQREFPNHSQWRPFVRVELPAGRGGSRQPPTRIDETVMGGRIERARTPTSTRVAATGDGGDRSTSRL